MSYEEVKRIWSYSRKKPVESYRQEVLTSVGPEELARFDAGLEILDTYISVAEGKLPESMLDLKLKSLLPRLRAGIKYLREAGTQEVGQLSLLRKLILVAGSPRKYSRKEKVLLLDELASSWHSGAFNVGRVLGVKDFRADDSLSSVARVVLDSLFTSPREVLEEQKRRYKSMEAQGAPESYLQAQRESWKLEAGESLEED